jgi:pimeloyl-ACP methyl ester carboxylesterase
VGRGGETGSAFDNGGESEAAAPELAGVDSGEPEDSTAPEALSELAGGDQAMPDANGETSAGEALGPELSGGDADGAPSEETGADVEFPPDKVFDSQLEGSSEMAPWAENRLYSVSHPALTGDKFIAKIALGDPDLAALFGGETEPDSSLFVLHVGPGCAPGSGGDRPVLLVHGAGAHAQSTFVNPGILPGGGLAPKLIGQGRCVFAVTFPHPFGNNFNQAVQLAAAMEEARLAAGTDRLDVVAHSKGGLAACVLASGMAESLGLEYQGDMARLVLLGVPLRGLDFSFRHPNANYSAEIFQLPMPTSWDKILEYGVFKDIYDQSIYGGAFDGVLQATAAWDDEYPLSMLETDWWTTYYGGQGFLSHSLGIAKAIEMGGGFIAKLNAHQVPDSVEVSIGSGGSSLVNGVAWETAGPSDGMVFRQSAEAAEMIGNLSGTKHFALLNHWDLVSSAAAQDWVVEILEK